jgi:hypothetical protein
MSTFQRDGFNILLKNNQHCEGVFFLSSSTSDRQRRGSRVIQEWRLFRNSHGSQTLKVTKQLATRPKEETVTRALTDHDPGPEAQQSSRLSGWSRAPQARAPGRSVSAVNAHVGSRARAHG